MVTAMLTLDLKSNGSDLLRLNSVDDLDAEANYVSGTTNIDIGYVEKGDRYFLSHINYKTNVHQYVQPGSCVQGTLNT